MSTVTFGREAVHTQGATKGAGLLGRVQTYLSKARAERQLSSLDDRLLADIGVSRSEISRMVWGN